MENPDTQEDPKVWREEEEDGGLVSTEVLSLPATCMLCSHEEVSTNTVVELECGTFPFNPELCYCRGPLACTKKGGPTPEDDRMSVQFIRWVWVDILIDDRLTR